MSPLSFGAPPKTFLSPPRLLDRDSRCYWSRHAPFLLPPLTLHTTVPQHPGRAARRSARRDAAGESQGRCNGFPNRGHYSVHWSGDPPRLSWPLALRQTVEVEQYGTILASSRHVSFPFPFARSRTLPRPTIQVAHAVVSRTPWCVIEGPFEFAYSPIP